jgi:hypothetical protein
MFFSLFVPTSMPSTLLAGGIACVDETCPAEAALSLLPQQREQHGDDHNEMRGANHVSRIMHPVCGERRLLRI